jgi:two-component sensor histidine kinase
VPYGTEFGGPVRLLYIDDDAALGLMVQKALALRGHCVVNAHNGAEGLAHLAVGDIDVIALDHSLPEETGLDILSRLGSRSERPPVVFVTGSADARLAVQAIKAGADDYVIKDVSGEYFELLAAAVEQVLERWRLRRQRAEDEKAIREARDQAEMLLQEVNHRIANSLGLVAAMVRMQASILTDPGAVRALHEAQTRITAIAGVHRHLYGAHRIGLVEIDDYLANLVGELQDSLGGDERSHEIRLTADRLTVATDKAVSLGIIVGELVTNAFKYAYPESHAGEIRVAVSRRGEGRARVVVEDDGIGFDPSAPFRGSGLGSKIVAAMAVNLDAEVCHGPGPIGSRFTIDFPVD